MLKTTEENTYKVFWQRLTKTVQIRVTDPKARWVLIESLAFENANLEFKKDAWVFKG